MSDPLSPARKPFIRPSSLPRLGATPSLCLATAALMVLAIMLGGGTRQGLWSDAIIQLASLGLIVFMGLGVWRPPWRSAVDLRAVAILAGITLLPLVQLVALPPAIWTAFPGRSIIADAYREAGIALPWLPISLDPGATSRAFLALLPAVAIFLATLKLDRAARRSLSFILLALGLVSVLLGLAQLMQGPASPLRFYPATNPGDTVGFFANRNHYAALLYALIPVAGAWIATLAVDARRDRPLALAVALLVYVALILGIAMARSRAGMLLAVAATATSLFLASGDERRLPRHRKLIIAVIGFAGLLVIVEFAFFRVISRFDADLAGDLRFTMASITAKAGFAYFPIGSGFGTFEAIYQMFEPVEALMPTYVNHAHNDWLEILLEGGVLAAIVLIAALAWLVKAGRDTWRQSGSPPLDCALAQAASIVILLLLAHSIVDYPLRTTAITVLFAWSAALLVPPPAAVDDPGGPRSNSAGRRHVARRRRSHRASMPAGASSDRSTGGRR